MKNLQSAQYLKTWLLTVLLLGLSLPVQLVSAETLEDSFDTLGPAQGLSQPFQGDGFIIAGQGNAEDETISFEIPEGVRFTRAYLYWSGQVWQGAGTYNSNITYTSTPPSNSTVENVL